MLIDLAVQYKVWNDFFPFFLFFLTNLCGLFLWGCSCVLFVFLFFKYNINISPKFEPAKVAIKKYKLWWNLSSFSFFFLSQGVLSVCNLPFPLIFLVNELLITQHLYIITNLFVTELHWWGCKFDFILNSKLVRGAESDYCNTVCLLLFSSLVFLCWSLFEFALKKFILILCVGHLNLGSLYYEETFVTGCPRKNKILIIVNIWFW